jgi:hypothetical protein
LAILEENRDRKPEEHHADTGRDVDHEVVGREDDRERHGRR